MSHQPASGARTSRASVPSSPRQERRSLAFPIVLGVLALILVYFIGSPVQASSVASNADARPSAMMVDRVAPTGRSVSLPPTNPEWADGIISEIRDLLQSRRRDRQMTALQTIVQLRKEYDDKIDLRVLAADLKAYRDATGDALSAGERKLLVRAPAVIDIDMS